MSTLPIDFGGGGQASALVIAPLVPSAEDFSRASRVVQEEERRKRERTLEETFHLSREQVVARRERDEARLRYERAVHADDADLILERFDIYTQTILRLQAIEPDYYEKRR